MMRRSQFSDFVRSDRWRNGQVRFIGFVITAAVLCHLLVSLLSDPLTALLGIDQVPGTVESNLGGTVGALEAHFLRTAFGVTTPVVPLVLGYIVARFLWPTRIRRVTLDVIWAFSCAILLAAAISAATLAGTTEITGGNGGAIGDWSFRLLVVPFGAVGAVLLPAAGAIALASVRIDRDQLERVLGWIRTAIAAAGRFCTRVGRGIARGFNALRSRSWNLKKRTDLPTSPSLREFAEEDTSASRPRPEFLMPMDDVAPVARMTAPESDLEGYPSLPSSEIRPAVAETSIDDWEAPSDLFTGNDHGDDVSIEEERHLEAMGARMMEALETYNIRGELIGRTVGARVVSFKIRPASGVKVSKFEGIEREMSLALQQESVRVSLAPKDGAISVEVPHPSPRIVLYRDLYDAADFRSGAYDLPIVMGVDLEGQAVVADLARMPHMLVAGQTGSGKSVALNVMLTSLCATHSPEDLRLILVDPKRVEFAPYRDLPHLRHEVICEAGDVQTALRWAVLEMERRYGLLQQAGVRDLRSYWAWRRNWTANPEELEDAQPEHLPYLVVVVDELADLMMTEHRTSIEHALVQIAQKARAVGIHLVLATQRPDANVVTGLLKANIPVRVAFRVTTATNSRIILDSTGAERLLGNGDMLFLPPGDSEPHRLQGPFLSTEETHAFVSWCKDTWPVPAGREEVDILAAGRAADAPATDAFGNPVEDRDDLFGEALRVCLSSQGASTSLLQRKLRIGYGRAARIIDQMFEANLIGNADGSKPREILYDEDLLETLGY